MIPSGPQVITQGFSELSAGGGGGGGGAVNSSETAMYFEKTIMPDGSWYWNMCIVFFYKSISAIVFFLWAVFSFFQVGVGWSILLGLAHQWNAHPVGQSSSPLLPAVTFFIFWQNITYDTSKFSLEELNLVAASNLTFDVKWHAYMQSHQKSKPN